MPWFQNNFIYSHLKDAFRKDGKKLNQQAMFSQFRIAQVFKKKEKQKFIPKE